MVPWQVIIVVGADVIDVRRAQKNMKECGERMIELVLSVGAIIITCITLALEIQTRYHLRRLYSILGRDEPF